jgi:hypothetical protein
MKSKLREELGHIIMAHFIGGPWSQTYIYSDTATQVKVKNIYGPYYSPKDIY